MRTSATAPAARDESAAAGFSAAQPPGAGDAGAASRAERAGLLRTFGLDIIGPIALHQLLTRNGVDVVPALVISGALPAIGIGLDVLRGRRIGGLSVLVLGGIAISVIAALVTDDPRFVLLEGAVTSAVAGAFSIVTLFTRRTLVELFFGGAAPEGTDKGRQAAQIGTAWISYLGQNEPIPDEQQQFEEVAQLDKQQNDLVWLKPAPMNNTYAFATRQDTADELGVKTLEDLKDVPRNQLSFCVDSEFAARNDGFQPMLKTYGLTYGQDVADDQVKIMSEGAIYAAIDTGQCTFGEVFTTDGRIKSLDLAVLEDTKNFFPKYNVSVVVRQETLNEAPQLRDLLGPVTDKLTDEQLIELNARVDVEGEEPVDVAWAWLQEAGFLTAE